MLITKHKYYKKLKYIYDAQKLRCNNPKKPSYKNYGGKGIKVEYQFRELFFWCLENGYRPGLCIGRIDHSKNYRLNNIVIETRLESTRERNARLGNPIKNRMRQVSSYCSKTNKKLKTFNSLKDCAEFYGKSGTNITNHCKGKLKSAYNGIVFRYGDGSCLSAK